MKDIISIKALFLTLLTSFLLAGCVSDDVVEEPDLSNYVLIPESDKLKEKVQSLLQKKMFLQALDYSLTHSAITHPELFSDLTGEAVEGLKQQFFSALEQENFLRALLIFQSVSVYTEDLKIGDWTEIRLHWHYTDYLYREGQRGAAFAYFQENLSFDDLDSQQLKAMESYIVESRNYALAEEIIGWKGASQGSYSKDLRSLADESREISDLLDGTVTIWVDKGIKIEQGIGTPEIIIGSGFFIDPHGYLLTNYHVIESEVDPEYQGFSKLSIRLSETSNEKIPARVIGWDKKFDLALLKVELEAPFTFSFTSSDDYSLGQPIFAIGSPAGLMGTVTSGTISATGRELMAMGQTLQVDVPINPGNSGGPLLNQKGEVLGVVFAGIEQFEGINFVIPGYYVKTLLPQLYQGGAVEHNWAGMGLTMDLDRVQVHYVAPKTSAYLAGLQKGDYVTSVNGIDVESVKQMQDIVLPLQTDSMIKVEWIREGKSYHGFISMKSRPRDPFMYLLDRDLKENLFAPLFGFDVETIGSKKHNRRYRVTRVYPGTLAYESGFSEDDLIQVRRWLPDRENDLIRLDFIYEGKNSGYVQSGLSIASYVDSSQLF